MPKFLPVPLAVVIGGHAIYAAVVAERYLAGQALPPGQLNSIVVASAIICALVTTRRPAPSCDCAAELDALRRQVRELQERPQRMYVPVAGAKAVGMDPDSIHALHRINMRLAQRDDGS